MILEKQKTPNTQKYVYKFIITANKKKKKKKKKKEKKSMIVEKQQSPIIQTCFAYKNNAFDICKSYPYLGTIICNNGQFKFNINELRKRVSRAMYTLLGNEINFIQRT